MFAAFRACRDFGVVICHFVQEGRKLYPAVLAQPIDLVALVVAHICFHSNWMPHTHKSTGFPAKRLDVLESERAKTVAGVLAG